LNRRRYAQNDDTLYVAPEDERTDYVSEASFCHVTEVGLKFIFSRNRLWLTGTAVFLSTYFPQIIVSCVTTAYSTGKRRYGHPALNGVLPEPWLPLKKGQTLVNHGNGTQHTKNNGQTVVLTLRNRYNSLRNRNKGVPEPGPSSLPTNGLQEILTDAAVVPNPWGDIRVTPRHRAINTPSALHHRLSFDHGSGVIMLPDDVDWLDLDEGNSDVEHHENEEPELNGGNGLEQSVTSLMSTDLTAATPGMGMVSPSRTSRYGTYFHHPERRRQTIPGAFPGR
jgi:hypothetical protein